jgi:hypothetical protein
MRKHSVVLFAFVVYAGIALCGEPNVGDKYASGALRGVTRDSSGQPLPHAQVTVHSVAESSDLTVVSGSDGAFAIASLNPGQYEVSARAEGFATLATTVVVVTNHQTAQMDLPLARGRTSNLDASDAGMSPAIVKALEAMQKRIDQLEAELKGRNAQARPEVATAEVPAKAVEQPQRTLLATIVKDPSAIPIVPGTLNRPEENRTIASNATPQNAPAPAAGAAPQNQAPEAAAPAVDLQTPFADYDWTWLNGNPRTKDVAFDSKFFTPEIRADLTYTYDFNKPSDDSMGGSSELFRSNEIQLEQLGIGGDFHWDNVRARFMSQFGAYSETTIRNDPSYAKGQWNLADADRYMAEAYGGYHINWMHGMNIDAGIFMSYIGLFSYYNFDNWAYQPSYVSSNTPWFFEGIRIQMFPTHHLKIEPWIINGWQSYASSNTRKGLGGQIKYTPYPWLNIISNNYGLGHDDLYTPNRGRIHTDNSFEVKYYDKPGNGLDKIAFTFTGDLGCEFGGGVSCYTDTKGGPKQSFVGYMLYNRFWFHRDTFGLTIGGGQINNPGRYLVLVPPINGESAASAAVNSPYFTFNPGDPFKAWDTSVTFDYMPKQWITFRFEGDYRHANVPYWSGAAGVTPPPGTNNGYPTQYACMNGNASGQTALSAATASCAPNGGVWFPDLRRDEVLFDIDLLVKF